MDNDKITRQQHLVPEAIRAIRAELMQKEDRPRTPSGSPNAEEPPQPKLRRRYRSSVSG